MFNGELEGLFLQAQAKGPGGGSQPLPIVTVQRSGLVHSEPEA